ncbi:hypothetical protein HDU89_004622 [Geranomyces variabilis]|nr:hypothetical protein HDU89_004622 [Geranomyces variabilis]
MSSFNNDIHQGLPIDAFPMIDRSSNLNKGEQSNINHTALDVDHLSADDQDGFGSDPKGKNAKGKKEKPEEHAVPILMLWRFATVGERLLIGLALLGSAAVGAIMPLSIVVLGSTLGQLGGLLQGNIGGSPLLDAIVPTILKFVWLGIAAFVAAYLSQVIWVLTGEYQTVRIRERYVRAILRQDIAWFDSGKDTSVVTKLAQNCSLIQSGISEKVGEGVQMLAQFVAGLIIAFIHGWKLALVTLAAVPLVGVVGVFMSIAMSKFGKEEQDAYAAAGSIAEESIAGIRTICAFSMEDRFKKSYLKQLLTAERTEIARALITGLGGGSFMGTMFLAYALSFWYGSKLVSQGSMNGGDVLVVFFALLMGVMDLSDLPVSLSAVASARTAAYTVFQTIDRVPEIDNMSDSGLRPAECHGKFEIKSVDFAYPTRPDVQILDNFSVTIPAGKTVAFVGSSGSGKSTIVGLLQRFYDVAAGSISLDGNPLKDINPSWLRSQIGLVGQEPVLFNTSIRNNIAMGSLDEQRVTQSDVEHAAKMANCYDFVVKLPRGFDTTVGEAGSLLSGGQKQRICIARAIIRNPRILILDEATSALDTAAERQVKRAIESASVDRTVVMIAHRLSTIRNADLIVVIHKGAIVEQGTHTDLLAKADGHYSRLVAAQTIRGAHDGQAIEEILPANANGSDDTLDNQPPSKTSMSYADPRVHPSAAVPIDFDELAREEGAQAVPNVGQAPVVVAVGSFPSPLRQVFGMAGNQTKNLILGIMGALLAGCVFPIFSLIFARIIVVLVENDPTNISPGPFQGANLYAFLFVIIAVASFFGLWFQTYFFGIIAAVLATRLRAAMFGSMLNQEMSFFDDDSNSLGALTTRLASEAAKISETVTEVGGGSFMIIGSIITGLTIAFCASWKLTFIVMLTVPFILFAHYYEANIRASFGEAINGAYEESGRIASEAVRHIRTVAALGREDFFQKKFRAAAQAPHKSAIREAFLASFGHAVSASFNMLCNAVGFYAGVRLLVAGQLSLTDMFSVMMAVTITSSLVGKSSGFIAQISKSRFSAIKCLEIIHRKSMVDPMQPGKTFAAGLPNGGFGCRDVAFAYPTRESSPIFTGGFNLVGKANQRLAIVGPSGCGKSTTIAFLQRWYDVSGGHVDVDGVNVKEYDVQWLRKTMALVGQEPVLFDMSIRDNILWATDRTDVSEAELDAACHGANIHSFIASLPNGYATSVGAKGSQLSGGQKQRIAIARALIRKPKMLLLDEATSALDSESEQIVNAALDKASTQADRTTVIIAHRLSSIQDCEQIAVVSAGSVAELGTHSELMALNGIYAELVRQQDVQE